MATVRETLQVTEVPQSYDKGSPAELQNGPSAADQ